MGNGKKASRRGISGGKTRPYEKEEVLRKRLLEGEKRTWRTWRTSKPGDVRRSIERYVEEVPEIGGGKVELQEKVLEA